MPVKLVVPEPNFVKPPCPVIFLLNVNVSLRLNASVAAWATVTSEVLSMLPLLEPEPICRVPLSTRVGPVKVWLAVKVTLPCPLLLTVPPPLMLTLSVSPLSPRLKIKEAPALIATGIPRLSNEPPPGLVSGPLVV